MQSIQAIPREISYLSDRIVAIIIDAILNFNEFFYNYRHNIDSLAATAWVIRRFSSTSTGSQKAFMSKRTVN